MNKEKTNTMEQEEVLICECCNYIIDDDDYTEWDGRIICSDCLEEHTTICDCCGSRIWRDNAYSDENTTICTDCYEEHYTRCSCCDALLYEDEAYYSNGDAYCRDCYEEEREDSDLIHDYSYKPNPIFYGEGNRYFGIELEIDEAGKDDDYAEELLDIQTCMRICSTSRRMVLWMMGWNWFRIHAHWTIIAMNSRGKIFCIVLFARAIVRIRQAPVVYIFM